MRKITRQQGLSLKYTPPSDARAQLARSQESHGSDLTESKGESADVGRQPGLKMLAALCLASAVEGHNGGKPGMGFWEELMKHQKYLGSVGQVGSNTQ